MATVKVGDDVYGWGADARELANDPHAYGYKVLDEAQTGALAKAIVEAGWEPFTKVSLEERQVFLIEPMRWRRPVQIKSLPGQILQVRELPAKPAPAPIPPVPDPVPPPESVTRAATGELPSPTTDPAAPQDVSPPAGGAPPTADEMEADTPDGTPAEAYPSTGEAPPETPEPPKEREGA